MKIEKSKIVGCKKVLKREEIPARFSTVGGDTYAIGTVIELDEVVEMEPVQKGGNSWNGVSALINGSVGVVGMNTLMGVYFDTERKRSTIDNGLNKSIVDLLGTTIKVVDRVEIKTMSFVSETDKANGKESQEIARFMPVFELVNTTEKAEKKTK